MIKSPGRAQHHGIGGVAGDPPLFQKESVLNVCRVHWLQNSPHSPLLHLLPIPTLRKVLPPSGQPWRWCCFPPNTDVNMAENVEINAANTTKVDTNLLRCAFAHPNNKFVLKYESYFGCRRNKHLLYARRSVRTAQSKAGVFIIGRFSSMEVAKRTNII